MLINHLPEAAGIRVSWDAFKHGGDGAIGQRAIDDVAVPGDPADIGRTPVAVSIMVVEDILMGERGVHDVPTRGVQYALGPAGRSRGVENEQRIFRIHDGRRAVGRRGFHGLVIPTITCVPLNVAAGSAHDQYLFDMLRTWSLQCCIDIRLQGNGAPAAIPLVGGDYEARTAIFDPASQGIRGKAGKDHRMHRADACAGQHGVGRFRNHRHVERDHIAFAHAHRLEHIAQPTDLLMEFAVRDFLGLVRRIAFPDDGGLIRLVR